MRSIYASIFPIVVLLGTAVAILFHAPGSLSPDSLMQLVQARTGIYSDSHPPIMALLWHVIDILAPGAIGMLFLQIGVFALALVIICSRFSAVPRLVKASAFIIVLFWPGYFFVFGAVWKDIGFVSSLLLAFALIVGPLRTRDAVRMDWALVILVALLLFYSINVRFNAGPALIPIIGLLVWQWSARITPWRRLAASVVAGGAMAIVLFAGGLLLNHVVAKTKANFWQTLAMYDLAGMSAQTGRNLLPHDLYPSVTMAEIKRYYTPRSLAPLTQESHAFADLARREDLGKLRVAWFSAIRRHPVAYLRHRSNIMLEVMGLTNQEPFVAVYLDASGSPGLGIGAVKTPWRDNVAWRVQQWAADSPIFRPYLYVVVGFLIGAIALALRLSSAPAAVALFASSLGNMASLFLTAPSSDYRYSLAVLVNTAVMVMMVSLEGLSRIVSSRGASRRGPVIGHAEPSRRHDPSMVGGRRSNRRPWHLRTMRRPTHA